MTDKDMFEMIETMRLDEGSAMFEDIAAKVNRLASTQASMADLDLAALRDAISDLDDNAMAALKSAVADKDFEAVADILGIGRS